MESLLTEIWNLTKRQFLTLQLVFSSQCSFQTNFQGNTGRCCFSSSRLPDGKHKDDVVRLVELIPYYIDLVWALQAQLPSNKSKTSSGSVQGPEKKKLLEEAEAKLGAEALRKKEGKEHARQMKKPMPKVKMSRGQ
ncbi:hypothetical protein YC2023_100017 [Brassica napus]